MSGRLDSTSGVRGTRPRLVALAAGIALLTVMAGLPLLGQGWTWRSGGSEVVEKNSFGVYGTKGVASATNIPGARVRPAFWMDASGNFWVFGGSGYASSGSTGTLNDLWKWDGTNWTWVSGSNYFYQEGTYGTKGVASATNVPGARYGAACWKDSSGNFWLFGGTGFAGSSSGHLNDLWKWDGANWTWVSGSNAIEQDGTYGTKGVASPTNVPGGRTDPAFWTDSSGNFWLFGGTGHASGGSGHLNDLWKWDGTNWTWVSGSSAVDQGGTYGTKGEASATNVPGARQYAAGWPDSSGNAWLFGGIGHITSGSSGWLNDLWKWDGSNWTWVSGSNLLNRNGTYGTKGVASPTNIPGGRRASAAFRDASGNTWLFGGYGYASSGSGNLADLWKWDGTNWTWMSGSSSGNQPASYGTSRVPAPSNLPGGREGTAQWKDSAGNFWIFGGTGRTADGQAYLNDLWRWDGTNWTWVAGPANPIQFGVFGTKGVPSATNVPPARWGSVTWSTASGELWLHGGFGLTSEGWGRLNDLWKWDGSNWTWMNGSSSINGVSVYGTKGVASATNVPGARDSASSWRDAAGNFWLFGGFGYDSSDSGYLNDLWKWDGSTWTWVSGSSSSDEVPAYGTKGVASATNVPGARSGASTWRDSSGNFWLFGGYGHDPSLLGYLNDLWKWDGTNWTWVSGSNAANQAGNYGTKGVASGSNVPGGRDYANSWTDPSGKLWLFGGYGYAMTGLGRLCDLWMWDGTNWTWAGGSNAINQSGTYGTLRVPSPTNVPGSRSNAVSWSDRSTNTWLFGGFGYSSTGSGYLNDLWRWDGANWTWMGGSNGTNASGTYGTKGMASDTNTPGARHYAVAWGDSAGRGWVSGGQGYGDTDSVFGTLMDLWSYRSGRIVAGDFNSDGQAEFTVYRPSTGVWYSLSSGGSSTATTWGVPGDLPVPADYDGDGLANAAVYRPSTGVWFSRNPGGGFTATTWGVSGDIPVPGDFDGDGKADPAVFRPSTGTWFGLKSGGGTLVGPWGTNGDEPVSGDFDGDGKTDATVVRNANGVLIWFILKSGSGYVNHDAVQWGVSGDVPVPADYDGDGKTDIAVFRPSTGLWYIKRSSDGSVNMYQWGVSGDIPQPADYDGDGKADVAVYRPGTGAWWVRRSSDGTIVNRTWGIPGDIPVTAPRY